MVKGFRQIAFLTMISRVLGFARDTAYAIVFGPGTLLDAWFIAFRIPNLGRRLFGEGAASSSVIPVYSEQLHNNPEKAARLARTVISVIFLVLMGLVLIGEIVMLALYQFWGDNAETKLVFALTAVTLPYMILICLVAIVAGLLNVHKHFFSPALAPIIMNLCIIAGAIGAALIFPVPFVNGGPGSPAQKIQDFASPAVKQIFLVAVAVIVAGLFEFAAQLPPFFKKGLSLKPCWDVHSEPFRRILRLMAPMIIGLSVTQINTLTDDIVAWCFSGSPEKGSYFTLLGREIAYPLWRGSVSYLGYAQHLYQLPLGIFGISLATALFPVMSTYAAKKDYDGLSKMVSQGIRGSLFIAIPCSIGLILVAKPFITVWLQHGNFQEKDVPGVVWPLIFYSTGITGYFLQQIIVRAFHSLQDPVPPVRTGLVAVFANFILNLILIWPLGTGGLAASTAICSYLQVFVLIYMLRRRLGKMVFDGVSLAALKTAAASILMTLAAITVYQLGKEWHNITKLAVVIPVSILVFIIASRLLRIAEMSFLTGKKSQTPSQSLNGND
jgi:putative peptidoglycan lipid II flippase